MRKAITTTSKAKAIPVKSAKPKENANTGSYHSIAILAGGKQKTIPNRSESEVLSELVMPFLVNGVVKANWGDLIQSYQVLELRIYKTDTPWNKKIGTISEHIGKSINIYNRLKQKAESLLSRKQHKVFIVTPIQGKKNGDQEQHRIYEEFESRFSVIEDVLNKYNAIAIRIDKEYALEDLVTRIKKEIQTSQFVVADLTDERPSCYFESGYAEALDKHVVYIASENSVLKPGTKTKIHFDIHRGINFFANPKELKSKLKSAIDKNKNVLFAESK